MKTDLRNCGHLKADVAIWISSSTSLNGEHCLPVQPRIVAPKFCRHSKKLLKRFFQDFYQRLIQLIHNYHLVYDAHLLILVLSVESDIESWTKFPHTSRGKSIVQVRSSTLLRLSIEYCGLLFKLKHLSLLPIT